MSATSTLAVVLHQSAGERELAGVVSLANELQTPVYHAAGDGWTAISVGDGMSDSETARFEELEGVERVLEVSAPYRLASTELFDDRSVRLGQAGPGSAVEVGGRAPLMVAVAPVTTTGARSPESMVEAVLRVGSNLLAAGELSSAFEDPGATMSTDELARVAECARDSNLLVSVEVADARDVETAAALADVIQVGHRSMQDFSLLRELGRISRPVIIKRGLGATIEEFLLAAEYVLANGNGRVILCEPGIRAQGSGWKPRFEVNAIPLLKQTTHLPVVADPSHSSANAQLIPAVARAAIAAGADGLILEVGSGSEDTIEGPMDVATCTRAVMEMKPVAAVMGRGLNIAASATSHRVESSVASALPDAGPARPADPMSLLYETQGTLANVIERAVGTPPRLDVVRQIRISPPYPTWLRWVLRPEGDLLVRWTRYVDGDSVLSRHLSYVDFGRVDPEVMTRLETEELNLGQLFSSTEIDKFGFEFGTGVNSGEFDRLIREGHKDTKSMHPYVWRRYIAATSGRVGFLVFEALPTLVWTKILRSGEDRTQRTGEG